MGSSGGGDSGAGMMALMQQGTPMPGLPIAGQGPSVNPFEYGKFQNFLPDIQAEGENPMATGLRPDMFKYRSPSGVVQESNADAQIGDLRNQLAALQASQQAQPANPWGMSGGMLPWESPFANEAATFRGGGG